MIRLLQMSFPKFLEKKFLEWQNREGTRKTISEFATHIGVSQSVVSMWMNGSRVPNKPSIERLSSIFGLEVYDALGNPRPDPDLYYIQNVWEGLTPEKRKAVRQQVEQLASKNGKRK